MGKSKTKTIQFDLSIFTHIPAYSGISRNIQGYPGLFWILCNPNSELWHIQNLCIFKTRGIFRTLLYSKLWHIQNQGHIQNPRLFRTLGYSEPKAYSEPCQISTRERFGKQLTAIIIFASYNYFHNISFSCSLGHEINTIFLWKSKTGVTCYEFKSTS